MKEKYSFEKVFKMLYYLHKIWNKLADNATTGLQIASYTLSPATANFSRI